jgi:hypothetical protein
MSSSMRRSVFREAVMHCTFSLRERVRLVFNYEEHLCIVLIVYLQGPPSQKKTTRRQEACK